MAVICAKENCVSKFNVWILKCYWKTENVEYPPRSPDLTPLDFFLWGALKNAVKVQEKAPIFSTRENNVRCK
jgi:hypothetical protein